MLKKRSTIINPWVALALFSFCILSNHSYLINPEEAHIAPKTGPVWGIDCLFFQLCSDEKREQEKPGKARFVPVSRAAGAKTYIGHGDPGKRTEAERERGRPERQG